MQLTIAIVSALVSLAGLGLKWYLARKDAKAAQAEAEQWKKLAVATAKENATLRRLMAEKEVQLVAAQTALYKRLSASELADALNGLFRGKQAPTGTTPKAGGSGPTAG